MIPFVRMQFTQEQRARALAEGKRRSEYDQARGMQGRNGGPTHGPEAEKFDILGAAGELAVAIYLGVEDAVFLDEAPSRDNPDLELGDRKVDVKTRSKHYYDLIIQRDGHSDWYYWLVTIARKEIRIQGWCWGNGMMVPEHIKDPAGGREAFFVPQSKLTHPEFW